MTGTSPFIGAGQFGKNAAIYRKKFLFNTNAMLEVLEESYSFGGRGIELIPLGKISKAAKIMKETHNDYIITGSTFPGPDPLIKELINLDATIIFVHGMISDRKNYNLFKVLDEIAACGVIPGIAAHNPISTLKFAFENTEAKTFLIPFNANGMLMGNQKELEDLIDNNHDNYFVGMKTLAAGKLNPQKAFDYVVQHNICCTTIGMVSVEEAKTSTKIALNAFEKRS